MQKMGTPPDAKTTPVVILGLETAKTELASTQNASRGNANLRCNENTHTNLLRGSGIATMNLRRMMRRIENVQERKTLTNLLRGRGKPTMNFMMMMRLVTNIPGGGQNKGDTTWSYLLLSHFHTFVWHIVILNGTFHIGVTCTLFSNIPNMTSNK